MLCSVNRENCESFSFSCRRVMWNFSRTLKSEREPLHLIWIQTASFGGTKEVSVAIHIDNVQFKAATAQIGSFDSIQVVSHQYARPTYFGSATLSEQINWISRLLGTVHGEGNVSFPQNDFKRRPEVPCSSDSETAPAAKYRLPNGL